MNRNLIRGTVAVVYVALCVFLLFSGKRHSLLIDNDASLVPEGDALPEENLVVRIDGGEDLEVVPKDRSEIKTRGMFHTILVIRKDDAGNEVGRVERRFRLALQDDLLLSMPALLAGRDEWMKPFIVEDEPPPEEEAGPSAEEQLVPPLEGGAAPAGAEGGAPVPGVTVTPITP